MPRPRRHLPHAAILNSRRQALGWTFLELAQRTGFASNTVMRCLHGENVNVLTFIAIARTLGIELTLQTQDMALTTGNSDSTLVTL